MTVDLTNIVNALLGVVLAAVTTAIPILVSAMLKRFGVANNADLAGKLIAAADAAAGAAYKYALEHEGGLARLDVHNAAIAAGVSYLSANMGGTMAILGITPANAEAMVTARLGALLAADPSVSAGTPGQVAIAHPAPSDPSSTQGTTP
jgi:hypothetical protein